MDATQNSMPTLTTRSPVLANAKFLVMGLLFGFILVKSQVISWYRIQEMFRFQSFHMYGVIGTAVLVGIISVWLIKRFNIRALDGTPITRKLALASTGLRVPWVGILFFVASISNLLKAKDEGQKDEGGDEPTDEETDDGDERGELQVGEAGDGVS